MASEAVIAKAHRLVAEGKVRRANATTYIVEGDTDAYVVTVLRRVGNGEPFAATCTCKKGREQEGATTDGCSHIIAGLEQAEGEA